MTAIAKITNPPRLMPHLLFATAVAAFLCAIPSAIAASGFENTDPPYCRIPSVGHPSKPICWTAAWSTTRKSKVPIPRDIVTLKATPIQFSLKEEPWTPDPAKHRWATNV